MTSIEDIWDAPLEPSSPRPAPIPIVIDDDTDENDAPRPSKRPRSSQPLFLEDSDDEHAPAPANTGSTHPDIEAMFQDIEDEDDALAFQPLAPALDVEALRRQAIAKHANLNVIPSLTPHAILSSSPPRDSGGDDNGGKGKSKGDTAGKDGERKERKKIARMDETRLVGPNGFPALIQSTKGFVPKGKGHEATDLNRLLQVYQFWTHKMYPKTQFKDTVDRVEKLCHSKRMHVSLSVWRDEAKGLINGMKPEDPDLGNADTTGVIDLTSDIEPEASSPSRAQQIRPSKVPSSPTTDADADVNMDLDVHSRPPSSSTEVDDDDFDIDALIKDEEERLAKMRAASSASASTSSPSVATAPVISVPQTAKATSRDTGADDDEEAMWDELNGLGDESIPPPPPPPPAMPTSVPHDEDEDMWDVVREMDAGIDDVQQRPYVPPPPPTPPPPVVEEVHPEPQSENASSSANVIASGHSNAVDEDADKAKDKEKEEKRPTNDEDWEDMYL